MGSTSTLSLYSHPKISFPAQPLKRACEAVGGATNYCAPGVLFPATPPYISRRRCWRSESLVVRSDGGPRRPASNRRVYKQSQSQAASFPVKEIASFIVPAGAFVAITFVLWKLVEKILLPKSRSSSSLENKPSTQGMKWSFSPGTNLLSGFGAKVERESRQRLNELAKELRAFRSVDMSGINFGDEGLFFLAESLAYNQTAEEVNFAANGITATGLKAFDGVLQSNIVLNTLDLSGNPIGDEGVKCLCDILVDNAGIQKLQLNSTNLGDEGAKAIAEMLKKNSSLRVLELNNNVIDYSGFTSIAGALLENNTIQILSLNGNYGGALGAAALAKGLERNKSLRELILHGNSIGDEGVRALMSGLSSHKGRLQHLDIGNNSISSKGAYHVAQYIKRTKSLVWLNMYMNDIGDEGAEKIAEALKQNRTVTNIDLGGNNIHAKGASDIAQVLKDNSVITSLEIGYNPIGPDGAKALSEVLKFHGNIKTLSLGWCQIGKVCLVRKKILFINWAKLLLLSFIGATMGTSELNIQTDTGHVDMPRNVCCVVVEYLPGGALKSFLIKNRRRKLAFKVVIQLALDLARGLSYLHSKKIVHRDVKTENMLLDKTRTVKIADFGVARVEASNPNDMTGETGTLGYMAPEVGNPYNRKCDVYSFGICLWEIYCCDMPYPDLSFSEVTSAVVRQE